MYLFVSMTQTAALMDGIAGNRDVWWFGVQ
jgi:hypothetical protein